MSRKLLPLAAAGLTMGTVAAAEAPRVVADIAPVHALVARVMDGIGTPDLVVKPGASPHEYTLRPSEAAALQEADVVVWIGPELTPWLDASIDVLAETATVATLMDNPVTVKLDTRDSALFEAHDHDEHGGEHDHGDEHDHEKHDEDHAHDDHAHEEHADEHDHDHDHAEHKDHEEHAEDKDAHGHAHGAHDPHVWLSPQNASQWLGVIADVLSEADPDNAEAYRANATEGQTELETVMAEVRAILDPVRDMRFIVFHDAYQYFENAFDMPAAGAISIGDASDPSAARIAEIQARIAEEGIDCVLAEPQFNAGLVATVLDGTDAKTGIMDPLGSDLKPGPEFYPLLIKGLATSLAECG